MQKDTVMTYEHLNRWTLPRDYAGATWEEYYSSGVGQSRDSDALERANFAAMWKALQSCETPQIVRESHWAVGWVEWIAIHESDHKALAIANEIKDKLNDYPVIDEELFSRYEDDECETVWRDCYDAKERAQYLRDHVHKVYPFPGETPYTMLRKAVKGDWGYAANLLPCPSDLIA